MKYAMQNIIKILNENEILIFILIVLLEILIISISLSITILPVMRASVEIEKYTINKLRTLFSSYLSWDMILEFFNPEKLNVAINPMPTENIIPATLNNVESRNSLVFNFITIDNIRPIVVNIKVLIRAFVTIFIA